MGTIYDTLQWILTSRRAIARDGHRCTVARLLGGECSGKLHAHHIKPVSDGGAPYDLENVGTACASHHPVWEALRRRLLANLEPQGPRVIVCRHRHPTAAGRRNCERRMAQRARERGEDVVWPGELGRELSAA